MRPALVLAQAWAPLVGLLLAMVTTACTGRGQAQLDSPTLASIQSRGHLRCGVEGTMPGFSFMEASGKEVGLDADLCRAVAAAVLGDGSRVHFRHLSAVERFAALASGEVDLLARNTSISLSRDAAGGNGLSFGPVVYYDSQGFLAARNGEIRNARQLHGQTICVVTGTTTEVTLADWMRQQGLHYVPLKFQSHDQSFSAYLQGRCGAVTSGRALLAARRSSFRDPKAHQLLPESISKEPFAVATRQGDPVWSDAVRWTVYALIEAEELGLRQSDPLIQGAAAAPGLRQSRVRRFLGLEGSLGPRLGLRRDFAARAVAAVGNYGELFERHLGPRSALALERGLQRLWRDGGLLQAPPFQ